MKLNMKNKVWSWLFFYILFLILVNNPMDAKSMNNYKWTSLPVGGAGFVTGIITSLAEENLIYARTDVGGAYRWNEKDQRWIPLLDWAAEDEKSYMGVESLAIDPQNPNRLYMLAGTSYWDNGKTAILRSDDYGESFEVIPTTTQFKAHGNGMGRQTGERLAVDPNKGDILFTGTRRDGLFKSSDRGTTWEHVGSFPVKVTKNDNGICVIIFDKNSSKNDVPTKTIYAMVSRTNENIFFSKDTGKSWSLVPGQPSGMMPHRAALANNGIMYITYADKEGPWNPKTGNVRKLDTVSFKWALITPEGYDKPFAGVSVDAQNPDRLVVSTINTWLDQGDGTWGDRIFLSENGGESWLELGLKKDPNGINWIKGHAMHWTGSIEIGPFNPDRVFVTSGNGVFSASRLDKSAVWKFTVKGLEETVPIDMISIPDGPVVTVIGDYDGFTYKNVLEYSPVHEPRMGSTSSVAFAAKRPNFIIRIGKKFFYSEDSAKTWVEITNRQGKEHGKAAVSADGEVILWCPAKSDTVYRTSDLGRSWVPCKGIAIKRGMPAADPVNEDIFYIYDSSKGTLYISKDKGTSFSPVGTPGSGGSRLIRTVAGKEGDIWLALENQGLMRSTDRGSSFKKIASVSGCKAVGFGQAPEGSSFPTVYIWGNVQGLTGIHRSTDEGKTWERINDDEHQFGGPGNGYFIMGDMNTFGTVYLGTVGRGIICGYIP